MPTPPTSPPIRFVGLDVHKHGTPSGLILVAKAPPILCRLLHHCFKGRNARLGRSFPSKPAGQLHDIDRGGNGDVAQMRFA